ncbi:MAG: FAD-binding protein, partial [Synechococcaceae cyanobacterium SM1_2_3]|nr:FAD-binding protein [Synechococcaceae cyanobacterium SM1_2_3]
MTTLSIATDVLIIGCGAAGLSLALRLADTARVIALAKGPVYEGSTYYAQGGVSAVLDAEDSIESHLQDTLIAGAGLCHADAVRFTVEHGRKVIEWLSDQGVPFTKESDTEGHVDYHLHREGGHSHRRVVHAADATGRAIQTTLEERARQHPNTEQDQPEIAAGKRGQQITASKKKSTDACRYLRPVSAQDPPSKGHGQSKHGDGGTENKSASPRTQVVILVQTRLEGAP